MSLVEHHDAARGQVVRCAVITLSDTRDSAADISGQTIRRLLEHDGHEITLQQILKDDASELRRLLDGVLADERIDAILTTGGTGISPRDQTIDVIAAVVDRPLSGFGELFRMLSYQQVGSAALLSRAMAGIARRKVIFALPGSTKAVELAMSKLILPELRHLVFELRK